MPELDPDDIIMGPSQNSSPMTLDEEVVVPATIDENDDIILSIRDDDGPEQVLKGVLIGLAEEQKALKDVRIKKTNEGKDISHIAVKRGTLLKYMSETLLQKQALTGSSGEIDLRGPRFREVFKMILDAIAETFDQVKVPAEYKPMFFQALSQNLDGWEERAERILKGKEKLNRQNT